MNSSNILTYTSRLAEGETPLEVFTEIEFFYVIREKLNRLDPGKCLYSLDEYDPYAHYILELLLSAHVNNNEIKSNEFAIHLKEHFLKMFGFIREEESKDLKIFTRDLFQDLLSTHYPSRTLKGKHFPSGFKIDYYDEPNILG